MSETASLYSTTATLIEQPLSALLYDDSVGLPASNDGADDGFLAVDQCYAILVANHDRFRADTAMMSRVGLPSSYDRGAHPGATAKSGLGKLDVRKRLQTQIPLMTLVRDRIVHSPIPTSVEELRQAREPVGRTLGRRRTLLQLIREDVVSLRTRLLAHAAGTLLFNGSDVTGATLYYPAHMLLKTPSWASGTKRSLLGRGSSSSSTPAFASTDVKWATGIFTSPAPEGSVDLQNDKEQRAERQRIILDRLNVGETDEDIVRRMNAPSDARQAMLDGLLVYLERRGVIWGQAGHMCKPSILNFDPVHRPQFVVQGLFPEPFIDRCKSYCFAGASINGKNCMKPEASETGKKATLIVSTAEEGLGNDCKYADSDFIEGWHVKFTLEPHQLGTAMTSGAAVGIMAGGVGGAF